MAREVIGQIDRIRYFPVKSCAGVETDSALLTPEGIQGDREFMIVRALPNAHGVHEFITQRDKREKSDIPQGLAVLSQIKPELKGNLLVLTWGGKDPIVVPGIDNVHQLQVRIWDDVVNAVDQGNEVAEWISDHTKLQTRLVKAAGSFRRMASQNYRKNNNPVRFPDGYPVHWYFQESVNELSEVAGEEVSEDVFRGNVVATGSPAQTEHQVYKGEIAGISFTDPKPCDRCPTTNVDQQTGEVKVGRALTHLAKYKQWRNIRGEKKVIFGENMLPHGTGIIRKGDEIVLLERRNPPLAYGAKA